MRLDTNCIPCNVNQAIRVCDLLDMERTTREIMMSELLSYLSGVDYGKCNPEIMVGTWEIIMRHSGNPNPYRAIKFRFNQEMQCLLPELHHMTDASTEPFQTALKIAIAGNLIDFAGRHTFNMGQLMLQIAGIEKTSFGIDHSARLQERLFSAGSLLYLGDNCGEIALDKFFIQVIKRLHPNLKVRYGVRGKPIVNDVTRDDAEQVGMADVAEILENGDGSLGTVLSRTTAVFREAYMQADVIIAKGQGNYESLSEAGKPGLFHLFMTKCEPVSKMLGVATFSIVCVENICLSAVVDDSSRDAAAAHILT